MITKEELELREVREEMSFLSSAMHGTELIVKSGDCIADDFGLRYSYQERFRVLAKREAELTEKARVEKP